MRLLLADPPATAAESLGSPLDLEALARAYAVPGAPGSWLRANMVATLDGAATGADGRTGSINTAADHVVFQLVRALSDVVLLGAGTARSEGYGLLRLPRRYTRLRAATGRTFTLALAVVTRSGRLPSALLAAPEPPPGDVPPLLVVTPERSPGLADVRAALGADRVLVAGEHDVDLAEAVAQLHARGLRHLSCEGGPHLLGELLAADLVDELDLTYSPTVVAGSFPRVVTGDPLRRAFTPRLLVEQDGTVLGRWLRERPLSPPG